MKRLGSRKWLLVVGALAIVLSLGVAACDSDSSDVDAATDVGAATDQGLGDRVQAFADNQSKRTSELQALSDERREAIQDRRERAANRRAALLEDLRDEMSVEDQALFDELRAAIEEQRSALEDDRQELADTLKELRALVKEYLGPDGDQSE